MIITTQKNEKIDIGYNYFIDAVPTARRNKCMSFQIILIRESKNPVLLGEYSIYYYDIVLCRLEDAISLGNDSYTMPEDLLPEDFAQWWCTRNRSDLTIEEFREGRKKEVASGITREFWNFEKMANIIQAQADLLDQYGRDADTDINMMNLNDVAMLDTIASIYRWDKYRMGRWKERFFCVGRNGEIVDLFQQSTKVKIDLTKKHSEIPAEKWNELYIALDELDREYYQNIRITQRKLNL